jgi:DNA-binding transcriptional LysR family regulator
MDSAIWRAFVEVARFASFSQAAEALHITQPAISKRISQLEAQLETPLFDRVGRHISLTETGQALLPRARDWLHELDDMQRQARDVAATAQAPLKAPLTGTLLLGTSHHIGLHRLPSTLRAFSHAHPKVRLDIRFIDSEQAYEAVRSGDLELGIVTLPPTPDHRLLSEVIWPDPLSVVAAPTHPLAIKAASKGAIAAADLALHEAILPASNTFTRQITEAMLAREGLQLQVSLETNYLETLKMMVSIGLGWSVLPTNLCDDEVVAIAVKKIALSRELGVVYHPKRALSRAARAMLTLLRAQSAGDNR